MRRVTEALDTNLFGSWQVTLALLGLLRRTGHGHIVNVSSGAGSLVDMDSGRPAYRLSKVGLNALTGRWAAELRRDVILVNSVCPGWVETDMGGPGGRPVGEGAAGIVWAATLPDHGPTGGFFGNDRLVVIGGHRDDPHPTAPVDDVHHVSDRGAIIHTCVRVSSRWRV